MNSRTARPSSITWRLALAITLILGAGGLLVTAAAYAYGRQAAGEAYDRLLAGAAFEIARSVSVPTALVVSGLLRLPALFLYARAISRGTVGTLAPDQIDEELHLEDVPSRAEVPEGPIEPAEP